MDMMRLIKAIRFANSVSHLRGEKSKGLSTFSKVTHHLEAAHEAGELTRHVLNKEVGSEDLQYVVRIGKRYGPNVANRVYARYMRRRALEAQEALEEEDDGPEAT